MISPSPRVKKKKVQVMDYGVYCCHYYYRGGLLWSDGSDGLLWSNESCLSWRVKQLANVRVRHSLPFVLSSSFYVHLFT